MVKQTKSNLSFASAGNGTPQHLADELFNSQLNVDIAHSPYKGAGPALNDVVGGTAAAFGDLIRSETVRLGKLVKASGATVD